MLDKVVFEATRLNLEVRERSIISGYDKQLPNEIWLKEFCTVHINVGRNTGKTLHIAENATEKDVVFVDHDSTRSLLLHKNKKLNAEEENLIDLNDLMHSENYRRRIYNTCQIVFVDEPKTTLKRFDNILDFYRLFSNNKNRLLFIFLGE